MTAIPKVHLKNLYACGWYPCDLRHRPGCEDPRVSTKHSEVTCSGCLAKIRRFNLVERSALPECPVFQTQSIPPVSMGGGWQQKFRCPVCARVNYHGAFPSAGEADGHRACHCYCFDGYSLEEHRVLPDGWTPPVNIPSCPQRRQTITTNTTVWA